MSSLRALSTLTDRPEDFRADLPAEPVLMHMDAGRFTRLLNMRAIEELIADRGQRHPMFTMSRDGSRLPGGAYTFQRRTPMSPAKDLADLRALRVELAAGATLICEQLHRTWRPIADFCRRLSYELGRPIGANSYLTPPSAQGFGIHYDSHGTFILQIEGRKTWELHRPITAFPLEDQRWREDMLSPAARQALREAGPQARYELVPGDTLWVPRGWLHEVFTTDEASLHLTLGLPELSRYRFAPHLLESLTQVEEFRRDLPMDTFASPEQATREAELVLKSLGTWLAQADPADIADRALAALHGVWYPNRRSPITAVLLSDAQIAEAGGVVTVREAVLRLGWTSDGRLALTTSEGETRLDAPAAGFVAGLLEADDPEPVPVDRYLAGLGPDGAQVIRTLLGEGIVELV